MTFSSERMSGRGTRIWEECLSEIFLLCFYSVGLLFIFSQRLNQSKNFRNIIRLGVTDQECHGKDPSASAESTMTPFRLSQCLKKSRKYPQGRR